MPKGRNKKVIELMKDELGGKAMIKFVGLTAKTYSYLIDDIKRKLKFEYYKNCLEATKLENKKNHLQNNQIDIDSIKKVIKNS